MADKIPGSRLLILEDAGHCAFLEEHEVLNAEIAAFADEVLVPAKAAARKRRRTSVRRVGGPEAAWPSASRTWPSGTGPTRSA